MIIIRIHIIGAGSIGLLFAHRLSMCGHSIHISTRTEEQARLLNKYGVVDKVAEKVTARTLGHTQFEQSDAVIIAVKQYHFDAVLPALRQIPLSTPLVFIQNGMAHLDHLASLPHEHIFVSTVEHGAKKLDDYTVQHNGVGWWRLACYKGQEDKVYGLLSCDQSDFPIAYEEDYLKLLRIKLIKNLMINPLTALFQVKNGVLAENEYLREMMRTLYGEIASVFPDETEYCSFEDILDLCKKTSDNESSMLSDIKESRETEIQSMTGYAIKIASQKGINPVILPFIEQGILAIQSERGSN